MVVAGGAVEVVEGLGSPEGDLVGVMALVMWGGFGDIRRILNIFGADPSPYRSIYHRTDDIPSPAISVVFQNRSCVYQRRLKFDFGFRGFQPNIILSRGRAWRRTGPHRPPTRSPRYNIGADDGLTH